MRRTAVIEGDSISNGIAGLCLPEYRSRRRVVPDIQSSGTQPFIDDGVIGLPLAGGVFTVCPHAAELRHNPTKNAITGLRMRFMSGFMFLVST